MLLATIYSIKEKPGSSQQKENKKRKEKWFTRMTVNPTDSFVSSQHRFQIKPIKGVVFVAVEMFREAEGTQNGAAISSQRATSKQSWELNCESATRRRVSRNHIDPVPFFLTLLFAVEYRSGDRRTLSERVACVDACTRARWIGEVLLAAQVRSRTFLRFQQHNRITLLA